MTSAEPIGQWSRAAGSGLDVEVDDETDALLAFADQLHAASGGAFDLTSGVLRYAWDFRQPRLPERADVAAHLRDIGWAHVERRLHAVRLTRPRMELDFGGFGKEYTADRAAELLIASGFRNGYVNLGGDIRVLGPRADGRPWLLGIRHPRRPDSLIAQWPLFSGALATSGDYERFIEVDGRRYCHILDPRTGWPVEHWASVTVAAPVCVAAGALTTIAMLKGPAAIDFLEGQHSLALAIDTNLVLRKVGAVPLA